LIEGLFRRIGAPVVCDLIVGRFRLIAADRYWLSDPFMSWFRWNFQQAQAVIDRVILIVAGIGLLRDL